MFTVHQLARCFYVCCEFLVLFFAEQVSSFAKPLGPLRPEHWPLRLGLPLQPGQRLGVEAPSVELSLLFERSMHLLGASADGQRDCLHIPTLIARAGESKLKAVWQLPGARLGANS